MILILNANSIMLSVFNIGSGRHVAMIFDD
jgi:hypothetical protein